MKHVLCELGNHSTFNSASLLLCIKNKLKERYEQFWEKHMKSDEKMAKSRTYKLIKKQFGLEKYSELNERKYRKALSAFRISVHRLNIERGRYKKLKVKDTLCTICNVIEDEIHIINQCTKFQMSRSQMIQIITEKKINMNKTSKEIFIDILTSSDIDILKAVGLLYIHVIYLKVALMTEDPNYYYFYFFFSFFFFA